MKFFGPSDKAQYLTGADYVPMAKAYWGPGPLPHGSKILGGYSDDNRAGALIQLKNGTLIYGNAGVITNVEQRDVHV